MHMHLCYHVYASQREERTVTEPTPSILDEFDHAVATLKDLPDTVDVANTLHLAEVLTGRKATTYIVRRFRRSLEGDTLFLQVVQGEKAVRVVLPPRVRGWCFRRAGVLRSRLRRKNGRRNAEERKARGFEPFVKRAVGR